MGRGDEPVRLDEGLDHDGLAAGVGGGLAEDDALAGDGVVDAVACADHDGAPFEWGRSSPSREPLKIHLRFACRGGVRTEFRLLGPVEVVAEGGAVALGGPKQRALLAELCFDAVTVPRERLVDALWGERPPASAVTSLQVYVHGLRRALVRIGSRRRATPTAWSSIRTSSISPASSGR